MYIHSPGNQLQKWKLIQTRLREKLKRENKEKEKEKKCIKKWFLPHKYKQVW